MKIIGIDPGTAVTGYSVIKVQNNRFIPITLGVIRTSTKELLPARLKKIYDEMNTIIKETKPSFCAVEDIFYSENVKTTVTLAHTRGVLLLCAQKNGLNIHHYTARKVKQSVTGNGNASKEQIQYMVKVMLGLKELPKPNDAADACATAICHINHLKFEKIGYKQ